MSSHLSIFGQEYFLLNRKESCHGIINGKDEKNAQLQKCPHAACSVYTGALEREYLKAESLVSGCI